MRFKLAALLFIMSLQWAVAQGSFHGDVIGKWLENGREIELTESFSFTDVAGQKWDVPKGTIVDGASIPRFLWTVVGAPLSGQYRKASVIHDHFCLTMSRSWQEVHKVFLEAQTVEGNSKYHSKLLYAGVYAWGPRWEIVDGKPRRTREAVISPSAEELDKLAEFIKLEDPDSSSIAEFTEKHFPR